MLTRKNYSLIAIIFLICSHPAIQSASALDQAFPERDYRFAATELLDSRIAAFNGITLNKLGYDLLYRGPINYIPQPVQPWVEGLWSFFWTFNFTMWPHDMGHWVRANQAGGDFKIDAWGFPFPKARMVDAPSATGAEKTLMSSGGFEINSLMRWETEKGFYRTGYRDADDMVHAAIQTLMFPMYTTIIAPTNPDKASTWSNTYGDPVDFAKLTFEFYTGRPAIRGDGTVDPELASLYREIFWASLLTTFTDPMLYYSLRAFSVDMKTLPRMSERWLYRSNQFRWTYTTRFNPGAIGYEVYFTQHMRIDRRYFAVWLRAGRPFENRGLGLYLPDIINLGRFYLDATAAAWDQQIFGNGALLSLSPAWMVSKRLQLALDLHWKSRGYAIGHQLEEDWGMLLQTTLRW